MSITQTNTYAVKYNIVLNLESQGGGEVVADPIETVVHAANEDLVSSVLIANLSLASNQSLNILEIVQVASDGNVYQ